MSASKQKRERREARAQGTDKQTLRAQEEQKNAAEQRSRKIKIAAGIAAAAIVLGTVVGVFASGSTYRSVTAAEVNDESLSAVDYNYYYCTVRDQYLQEYNTFMSQLGLSVTAAEMEALEYEEGKTWKEFFEEQTIALIQRVTALNAAAEAEGIDYSTDVEVSVKASENSLTVEAAAYEVTVDQYLADGYGRGMNLESWRELAGQAVVADLYADAKMATYTYTDDEAIAYYDENVENYRTYNYRAFQIAADGEGDDAIAAAEQKAKEFVSRVEAGEAFADVLLDYVSEDSKSYYEESDLTLYEDTAAGSISSYYSAWVTDAARRDGELGYVVNAEDGYVYVLNFISKSNDTDAVKVEKALPDMQLATFNSWLAEEMQKYPVTTQSTGMYFADKAN